MAKSKEKQIETYDQLKEFTLAIIRAIGDISKDEATVAIEKAFKEFRENFSRDWQKSIDELSQHF